MFDFFAGFVIGVAFIKFYGPICALWKRTEKKIEKSINDANVD